MIQKSLIILALTLLLPLPAWSALTFGVVPREGSLIRTEQQALQFAKALQNQLAEEVKIRIFADETTLHAWLNRYQLVDIAVFSRNYVKNQPAGEFFHLSGSGAFGSLDPVVVRQGMVRRQGQKLQRAITALASDVETRAIFQQPPAKPAKQTTVTKSKPTKSVKAKSPRKGKAVKAPKVAAPTPTKPPVPPPATPARKPAPKEAPATTTNSPPVAPNPPVVKPAAPETVAAASVPVAATPTSSPIVPPSKMSGVSPPVKGDSSPIAAPKHNQEPARRYSRETAAPATAKPKASPLSSMTGLALILGSALLLTALGGLFLRRRQHRTRVTTHEPTAPPVPTATTRGTIISAALVKEQLDGDRSGASSAASGAAEKSQWPATAPREETPVTAGPLAESGGDPLARRQSAIEALYDDVRRTEPSSGSVAPELPPRGSAESDALNPPEQGFAGRPFATEALTEAPAQDMTYTSTAGQVPEEPTLAEQPFVNSFDAGEIPEATAPVPDVMEAVALLSTTMPGIAVKTAEPTATFAFQGNDLPDWPATEPETEATAPTAVVVDTNESSATYAFQDNDLPSWVATETVAPEIPPTQEVIEPTEPNAALNSRDYAHFPWSVTELESGEAFAAIENQKDPAAPDLLGDLAEISAPAFAPTEYFAARSFETIASEPFGAKSATPTPTTLEPAQFSPVGHPETDAEIPLPVFKPFAKDDPTPESPEKTSELPVFGETWDVTEASSLPENPVIPFVETGDYKTFFHTEGEPVTSETPPLSPPPGKVANRTRTGKMALRIQGELGPSQTPALLKLISGQRKAGLLTVDTLLDEKQIFFNKGKIAAVRAINPDQRTKAGFLMNKLGELLLRQELITPQQRDRALEICLLHPQRRLGEVLLETTQLTPEELQRTLRIQAEEILFSLLLFPVGGFEYVTAKNPIPAQEDLAMDVTALLRKAALQVDEWRELRKVIPTLTTVMEFKGSSRTKLQSARMTPPQEQILSLVDGHRTVREICQETGMLELEICKFLLLMTKGRILQPVKAE